jgi:hypothetical protein
MSNNIHIIIYLLLFLDNITLISKCVLITISVDFHLWYHNHCWFSLMPLAQISFEINICLTPTNLHGRIRIIRVTLRWKNYGNNKNIIRHANN